MIVVYRSPYERHKSARRMPWPRTAMKDATNLRKASGRRFVACDPEISEWGNPICLEQIIRRVTSARSEPWEVKHLSTRRKREQYELHSVRALCLCEWNATLVIPRVAASEKGKAQTSLFGAGGCKMRTSYLYEKSYKTFV